MVSQKQLLGLLSLLLLGSTLSAQCINDQCGDIFADWALLSEETTVCEGATFEVANQTLTPGIDFYVWDWGNGDRDTVYEVANYFYTYLFDEATACATSNEFIIYNISLEIYRYCDEGMSCHTQIAPVAIRFKPRASFSLPAILCAGDTVPATNLSCNADTYEWIFSDGTTSDEMHPQHVFDTAGVYDVTLVVSNGCGTDTVTQSVEVLPKPVAAGGLSDESSAIGCAPLTVAFTNASEFADGFNWIFPDSAGVVFLDTFTPQSAAPVVEFTQPGTFAVRMEAGNECGFQEWTTTIEVVAPPQVTLEPLPAACETASLQLGDYLSYSGDIDTFHWTVQGPETPSLPDSPSPLLTVSTPGDYTIALTVSSDYCPAAFDSTDLQIQTPEVLTLTPPAVSALCDASDPVSFTATPAGGAWQGPGVDSTGLFDPGQAGVGTHTLTYQYGSGACLLVDSLSVTVLDAPEVTAAPNLDLCETGSPVQLDFSPAGGNWSGPGIVDATQGLFDPLSSGPGDFSLTYTLIAANQCELRQTTEVTVQPLPEVMAPDTSAFCVVQTTINLGAELQPTFDPAGGTINWSGPGITDSLQGIFVHDGTEGIYPVQIQYAFDFCTAGETIYVSIVDPEAAAVGPDRTACLNDGQLTLTGSPAGGRWTGPGLMDEFSGEVDLAAAGAGDHVYRYTLAGGTSCEVRDELTLTIVGPTNLEAGPDQIFCADESQATLPVATPAGGQWSGPGLLDATTGALILDQLPPDADYTYAYTINDSSGCTFADSVQVRVNGLPAAAFALPDYSCVTAPLTFATSEEEAVTYQWDFGDGEQAVGHEVSYSYPAAGTYAVILEATNAAGCNRTATDELTIATIPQPRFEPATDDGCGPLTVQFADASAGTDLTYDWDFGNGTSSTDAVPPPAIYAAGIFDTTYHVRLELSNACGADSWVDTITVRARPVANFGTLVNTGCGPLEVALANTTLGSAQSYFWDFGNGQTATDSLPAPPVLTTPDTAATIYTITLQASNTCGTDTIQRQVTVVPSNVTAFFNTDQTQGCAPLAVNLTSFATYGTSVTWNFGDGVTGSGAAVSHTFDSAGLYTVFQYVENACGRDSLSQLIEVFPAPMALFDHPSVVCADQPTAFNNLSGEYQTMLWDFGDGQTSTAVAPTHVYDSAGIYLVTLTLTHSASACPASYSSTVTVLPPPTVSLTADQLSGCPPLDVCFSSEVTGASFLEWDFGDGNHSTNLNPCHSFFASGQYRVTLRGADEQGCFSRPDTVQVHVFPEPVAGFVLPEEVYCGSPQAITFTNTSTQATAYDWSFGNGVNSTLTSPAVTYTEPGSYTVYLQASNTFGCTDETEAALQIVPQPLADFFPIMIEPCAPQQVVFDNASVDADAFWWSLGDGVESIAANPVLTYDSAGWYDVTLVAGQQGLCFDTLTLYGAVELFPRPQAAFSWEVPAGQYQGLIQFMNESVGAVGYDWDFGDGATSAEVDPLHDYALNGSWVAELIATAANGCTDTAAVAVEPETMYGLFFPNAFSPESGEGEVRVFKPAGTGLVSWSLEIFSPWGQRVFRGDEINGDRPAVAWDGHYQGKLLPQGAYAYKATAEYVNGIRKIYTGSVTLLR